MRSLLSLLLSLLICTQAPARDLLTFKVSKPLCLLTFLQAASQTGQAAPALTSFIHHKVPAGDTAFSNMVNEFAAIGFDNSYAFPEYPDKRFYRKTVTNLITMAAVNTATVDEFMERVTGILPNEQWLKLRTALTKAAPYYDRLIGTPYAKETQQQLTGLAALSKSADTIFSKLQHFYGSTWSADIPFTVCLYPVPAKGATTATPHSNSLVVAVPTGEKDHEMRLGIAIHEICHVLYQEQPLSLQHMLDSLFNANKSPYSPYAYTYIDEALATACGNGWAYNALAGRMDKTGWYNDDYIDGYAHALYPLVAEYIAADKVLDGPFINKAIDIFRLTFPGSLLEYSSILNSVHLYTDAGSHDQYAQLSNTVRKQFRMSSCTGSYPITDPESLDMISQSPGTQVFLVHTNHEKNYEALKAQFPQIKDLQPDQEGIASFIDGRQRPVIIVNVRNAGRLDEGIKALAKNRMIDPNDLFKPF